MPQTPWNDETAHQHIRDMIPAYIHVLTLVPDNRDELASHQRIREQSNLAPAEYDALVAHLDQCDGCQEAVDLALELAVIGNLDLLDSPASIPRPQLDFLKRPAQSLLSQPWSAGITRGPHGLTVQFSPALLQSCYKATLHGPHRANAEGHAMPQTQAHYQLTQSPVVVKLTPAPAPALGLWRLVVRLTPDEDDTFSMTGALITLHGEHSLREQHTDRHGEATFERIPATILSLLRIDIEFPPAGER